MAGAIDERIIRNPDIERFAVLRAPAPRNAPQVRVVIAGANRQRTLTLEQPALSLVEDEEGFDVPPEEQPAQQLGMQINFQTAVLGRDNFDRWVFGDRPGEAARRGRMKSQITQHLEAISRKRPLTAAQESKLRLAGLGDIKRFFDRVEDRRRQFEGARGNFQTGVAFLNSLDPLGKEFEEGPFGDGSLFAKTLRRIEDDARTPGK